MQKSEKYSYSQLSCYSACARKFQLQYIDKISVPRPVYFRNGSEVHSLLEKYTSQDSKTTDCIERFFSTECGKEIKDVLLNNSTVKREMRFGLTRSMEVADFNTGFYRGIIDLYYIKDGRHVLADYKTGKVPNEPDFRQLLSYAYYIFVSNPELETIDLKFLYIDGLCSIEKTVTREEAARCIDELVSLSYSISFDNTFAPNVTDKCKYCVYKDFCTGV